MDKTLTEKEELKNLKESLEYLTESALSVLDERNQTIRTLNDDDVEKLYSDYKEGSISKDQFFSILDIYTNYHLRNIATRHNVLGKKRMRNNKKLIEEDLKRMEKGTYKF